MTESEPENTSPVIMGNNNNSNNNDFIVAPTGL